MHWIGKENGRGRGGEGGEGERVEWMVKGSREGRKRGRKGQENGREIRGQGRAEKW